MTAFVYEGTLILYLVYYSTGAYLETYLCNGKAEVKWTDGNVDKLV
jgi:hypothetical protein